jgi:hypothetical protein
MTDAKSIDSLMKTINQKADGLTGSERVKRYVELCEEEMERRITLMNDEMSTLTRFSESGDSDGMRKFDKHAFGDDSTKDQFLEDSPKVQKSEIQDEVRKAGEEG